MIIRTIFAAAGLLIACAATPSLAAQDYHRTPEQVDGHNRDGRNDYNRIDSHSRDYGAANRNPHDRHRYCRTQRGFGRPVRHCYH